MSNNSAHLSYHVQPDTEVVLRRDRQGSRTNILSIGSTAYDSPSGSEITLFFKDDADLRRLRDAINGYLGDDPDRLAAARDAALDLLGRASTVGSRMLPGEDLLSRQAADMRGLVNEALDALRPGGTS